MKLQEFMKGTLNILYIYMQQYKPPYQNIQIWNNYNIMYYNRGMQSMVFDKQTDFFLMKVKLHNILAN